METKEQSKEQRLKWVEEGAKFMDEGASLSQFKEKLRQRGATHNSVVYVSERLLEREFQKSTGSGLIDATANTLIGLTLIVGALVLSYVLWTKFSNRIVVSSIPIIMLFAGLKMLSNK